MKGELKMKKKISNFKKEMASCIQAGKVRIALFLLTVQGIITSNVTASAVTYSETEKVEASNVADAISKGANWVMTIAGVIAAVALIVAVGYPAMTDGQEGITKAKKNAKGIIIGLAVVLLAFGITKTIVTWIKTAQ